MKKAPEKKNFNLPAITIILAILFGAGRNILGIFLMLLLPLGIFAAIFIAAKKNGQQSGDKTSAEELRRDIHTAAGGIGKEIQAAEEFLKGAFLEERPKGEQAERSTPKQSVNPTLFERAEQRHLQSLSGTHDERAHQEMELRDLLNAGIIDHGEYADRLRDVRNSAQ